MTKTAAEIREDIKRRSQKSGKNAWVSIKPGTKVFLRIGPPWKKNGDFWKDALYHGYFKEKVYCRKNDLHPETGKPRKCPVCVRLKELESDRSTFGKKLWSLIKLNTEGLWNVAKAKKFIRKPNGKIIVKRYEDNKFKILRLSPRWQNLMMDIFGDEDYRAKSILGVTHLKYGRLVKAARIGSGPDDTNYSFTPVDVETPIFLSKEKRIAIKKTLIDLDSAVRGSSQEECEAFLERMEKKAKKLARREKEEQGDDDEDLDDTDEEEDDEEEESEDEEEEESEDDDEEDMEARYKRIKKSVHKKKHAEEDDDE